MTDEPVAPVDPPEPPAPYDAGDPAQVKDKRKRAKRIEEQRLAALRGFMSIPEGRRWIWWLLGECHVFASSFRGDPHLTSFNEGARNVGLTVLAEVMRTSPDEYLTMTKEAKGPEEA